MARLRGESIEILIIDNFKSINYRFWHAVGDEVLRSAATLWRGALRRQDILGCLGGEEFSVILPKTDLELAIDVAERLRHLAEQQPSIGPENCSFTISLGLTTLNHPKDGMQELLKKADNALYHAKQNGRNRVEVYRE
ncbi:diguanylate cyclase [Uliginosibacterium gangwonense]|uniref:GGDEF domain-containing protein n=1 Tax=Uliginosibacterium gangwonense TaxID=392736 RepID=UPI0003777313